MNKAHLKIAKRGFKALYRWRERNPHVALDLEQGDLRGAMLINANLCDANLRAATLSYATFICATLVKANLQDADLRHTNLVHTDLSGAILTGAKLYGTARDDWVIKGVQCEYVYWDNKGEHRCPKNRDFEPGEFERIYAMLPSIEYFFENGMSPIDPLIMDRVVEGIRQRRPEFDIKIDSVNARGLAPSIKLTVRHEEQKEPALAEVREGYKRKIRELKAERDRYYALLARALDAPKETRLTSVESGAVAAIEGSTINIHQHIHNAVELQKTVADEPEDSETFVKLAKRKALDIIGGALEDIAKGQVKKAGKVIVKLGKDLGPIILKTAAYAFFKGLGG